MRYQSHVYTAATHTQKPTYARVTRYGSLHAHQYQPMALYTTQRQNRSGSITVFSVKRVARALKLCSRVMLSTVESLS